MFKTQSLHLLVPQHRTHWPRIHYGCSPWPQQPIIDKKIGCGKTRENRSGTLHSSTHSRFLIAISQILQLEDRVDSLTGTTQDLL